MKTPRRTGCTGRQPWLHHLLLWELRQITYLPRASSPYPEREGKKNSAYLIELLQGLHKIVHVNFFKR